MKRPINRALISIQRRRCYRITAASTQQRPPHRLPCAVHRPRSRHLTPPASRPDLAATQHSGEGTGWHQPARVSAEREPHSRPHIRSRWSHRGDIRERYGRRIARAALSARRCAIAIPGNPSPAVLTWSLAMRPRGRCRAPMWSAARRRRRGLRLSSGWPANQARGRRLGWSQSVVACDHCAAWLGDLPLLGGLWVTARRRSGLAGPVADPVHSLLEDARQVLTTLCLSVSLSLPPPGFELST
jgi:hypothetical protein